MALKSNNEQSLFSGNFLNSRASLQRIPCPLTVLEGDAAYAASEESLAKDPVDLELKFDGEPVKRLDGAPVEAVVSSLNAIQRMVHIIGMRAEGRALSERLKPTSRVKREYAVVCRSPKKGSHIQPFAIETLSGEVTGTSLEAREKLLATLKAIDSGSEARLNQVIPNARERWFLAKAASGLVPPEGSGIEVMIRSGTRGPFAFTADRARPFFQSFDKRRPPSVEVEVVAGKLSAIDYGQTIMTIKPGRSPSVRMDYPLPLESWLQANVRKRLIISGKPRFNNRGDISSFQEIETITETEPHLEPIDRFKSGGRLWGTIKPVTLPITVYWADRMFAVRDSKLGIDVVAHEIGELRDGVLTELDFVWRHYAEADDRDLDEDARRVAAALRSRFGTLD